MTNGDLEVVKDNLSRYIYTLNECQFWFDQPAHDNDVDLGSIKTYDDFVVTMDYKYVTSKFERWTPDGVGFGKYVSYNNGAIWKVGNPGARSTIGASASNQAFADETDIAVPRFYTNSGGNTLRQNGVDKAYVMDSYNPSSTINESVEPVYGGSTKPVGGSASKTDDKKALRKKKRKEGFDAFKSRSSKAGVALGKKLKTALQKEIKAQISIRLRLLNNTLDKLRNEAGLGRMREPTNVYKNYDNPLGISAGFFFDVKNSLRDFAGDSLGGKIGGFLKGGNKPLF